MEDLKEIKDNGRTGPTLPKLFQLFKLFFPRNTETLARIDQFSDLDPDALSKIIGREIKGIIIDVDDTIAPHLGNILKKNHEHLLKLKKRGYKMVLYSNLRKSERYKDIENDVPILTNLPAKPDIEGYQIACDRLGLTAKEVIMVGDNYITDAGSINCGIPFVKVKPIKNRLKSWPIRIKLIPYVIARGFYSTISDIHQFFRKKV